MVRNGDHRSGGEVSSDDAGASEEIGGCRDSVGRHRDSVCPVCETAADENVGGTSNSKEEEEEEEEQEKKKRKKRRPQSASSDSTPQVYKFVQPKREGASPRLRRTHPKGTRRPADPRRWRAKMVEEQLDDLALAEPDPPPQKSTGGRARDGVSNTSPPLLAAAAGHALELAEALQDLVIVSADGGCRWPVDRGGRIVLTSWPADEKWWKGYPENALVCGPEEAGDIPREVVLRVSEKPQSEADATAKASRAAAESAAEKEAEVSTGPLSSGAESPAKKSVEAVDTVVVNRSNATAFEAAAAAVAQVMSYTYEDQLALGLQRIHAHRYREAIVNFKRCHTLEPTDPAACYNLACCYSLLRLSGLALRWLTRAVDLGLADGGVLLEDTDLDNIRDAPRFRRLQQQLHRETAIVGTTTIQRDKNDANSTGAGGVNFHDANEESGEEDDLAAELVDAHLLGLPPPSTHAAESDLDGHGPSTVSLAACEATATPSAIEDIDASSDRSTQVSSQTDSEDEAEVAKIRRERPNSNRRKKSNNPEVEPAPENENRKSQYHGVSWNTGARLWNCQMPFDGQLKFIGQFDDETEAAHAHDDAAHETFGADKHCNTNGILLNFPLSCADCRTWGQACMAAGEPQEATDWFEQALEDASQPSDDDKAMVAYELAGCYATCLDSSLAIRWLSDAIHWGLGTNRAADKFEPHAEAVFASLWRDARFLTLCAKLDEERNGPARREHTRLVRRHRAARASACVKTALDAPVTKSGGDGEHAEEHSCSPTFVSTNATNEPEARGEDALENQLEHELDLFFEFWTENGCAMNDLFSRLATRLIPLDLIRTTLNRVIGGLNLEAAGIEDCILIMLGLGAGSADERCACGTPGAPSLFFTDIERVSRVTSSAKTTGIKSGGVKMSASARHRTLKTEALCRAVTPNQMPQGDAATVPVLARVVDREEFLSRCGAVATAWSRAASRNLRSEWLQEFELDAGVSTLSSVDQTDDGGTTISSDTPLPTQTTKVPIVRDRGPVVLRSTETLSQSSGGLAAADVNMPRDRGKHEVSSPLIHDQLVLKEQDVAAPKDGGLSAGQRRWQDASHGLPEDVRRDWTVATVSMWLRTLGLSDSVVGRAHAAQIDGARLLDAAGDPDSTECTNIAEILGLTTLGSRKLLGKAVKRLAHRAERLLGDRITSPPRGPDTNPFALFGSNASSAEQDFLRQLERPVADGNESDQDLVQENDAVLDSFGFSPRELRSQPVSPSKPFSFGDVSSITTGL